MKKNKKTPQPKSTASLSPIEALRFLEAMRTLSSEIDEPTVAISLRVPANILRALKLKAKSEGKKYQSLMVSYFRKGLREK